MGDGLQQAAAAGAEVLKSLGSDDTEKVLANLQKLKEIVHTTKSSHMGPLQSGRGFSCLHLVSTKRNGIHMANQMEAVFNQIIIPSVRRLFTDQPELSSVPAEKQEWTLDQLRIMRDLFGISDAYSDQSIAFKNGQGSISVLFFGYRKKHQDSNEYQWYTVYSHGAFQLAPDYFVVRHTKSNFWSTKSRDEIQYVQRGVTTQDISDLVSQLLVCQQGAQQMAEITDGTTEAQAALAPAH